MRGRFFLYRLLLLWLISSLFAGNSMDSPARSVISEGIHHLYNYRLDEAISTVEKAMDQDPENPVGPFLILAAKWLKTQTESGYEASYNVINQEIDRIVPWYENMIRKYPHEAEYLLYLGSTYGMRARIALAKRKWLDVIVSGYRGFGYVKKAKKADANLLDVYMPFGLMEYYSCKMSAPLRFTAELLGIDADCEAGLSDLEYAASRSPYSWIESSNVLTYAYLYIEKDFESALKWIRPLTEEFPHNPMFALLLAETLAKLKRWEELEELYPRLDEFVKSGPPLLRNECDLKFTYVRALRAFDEGDLEKTIRLTTYIIDNYQMEFNWLWGFAHILRGKCYDLQGNRKLAIEDYAQCATLDNKYPEVDEARYLMLHPYHRE